MKFIDFMVYFIALQKLIKYTTYTFQQLFRWKV